MGAVLRGEGVARRSTASAHGRTGGLELVAGTFRERRGPELVEQPVRPLELCSGVDAAALPAQPLAVAKVDASEFHPYFRAAEPIDRLAIQLVRNLTGAHQSPHASRVPESPVGAGRPGHAGDDLDRVQGVGLPPETCRRLDEFDHRVGGQPEFVRVLTASPGCLVGLVVPAQPVVEHGCRPIGVGQDLRLPAQEEVVRERVDRVAGRGLVAFSTVRGTARRTATGRWHRSPRRPRRPPRRVSPRRRGPALTPANRSSRAWHSLRRPSSPARDPPDPAATRRTIPRERRGYLGSPRRVMTGCGG